LIYINNKKQNTRHCGDTLFAKEGKDWNGLTPALFRKEGTPAGGGVLCK